MRPPKSYAEWINCFDSLKEGTNDEQTILVMEQGSIEWTRGVAERLTDALYETIKHRLNESADRMQKELDRSNGDEARIVKALLSARKRLALMNRVAQLDAFPENVRESMGGILKDYAKSTEQSMMDSAKTDRTGRLRMLIKNNAITQFDKVEHTYLDTANNDNASSSPQRGTGFRSSKRRVIIT